LIFVSPPRSEFASAGAFAMQVLPRPLPLVTLPAEEPPASAAFVSAGGVWHVVVPVHMSGKVAGYVALCELVDGGAAALDGRAEARSRLPVLERSGDGRHVVAARWASRILSEWLRHDQQIATAADELAFLGDIGKLISGEGDLQTTLNQIVAETARVMRCRYASMRLLNSSGELAIAAVYNLGDQYIERRVTVRARSPIDDQALAGNVVYIEDAQNDPRIVFPEIIRKIGVVSGLAAGMFYRDQPIGVLRIYADHKRRFRTAQRTLLHSVATQAAIGIANARLVGERLRAAEIERELAQAGQVQARLVRLTPPNHPRIDSSRIFEPSSHLAGDFCDIFELSDGRIAAVIGDVVGHGLPASLLMASVRSALRAYASHTTDLSEVLTRLNRHVHAETHPAEFVSLLLIALDPAGMTLSYCNAGHEPPMILRDGEVISPDSASLVLGVAPGETYEEESIPLADDDFVLLYTDGVVEAMNFEGEQFGRPRLIEALRAYGESAAGPALQNIRWDVRRFVGLAEQSDDLTLVGLRLVPAAVPVHT
jgi:phosphoserine phosphatase RsbU/P